jgi:hypothetical protein
VGSTPTSGIGGNAFSEAGLRPLPVVSAGNAAGASETLVQPVCNVCHLQLASVRLAAVLLQPREQAHDRTVQRLVAPGQPQSALF